jgi:hypothetical protein
MNDLVKGAMYVAAAAVLVQGVKKDNILSKENVRNGAIGALAGIFGGPTIENMLSGEGLSEEAKHKILGAAGGGAIGVVAGYLLSSGAAQYIKDELKSYIGKVDAAEPKNENKQ